MSAKRKFWMAGLALAAVGIVLARLVSQRFEQPIVQLVLYGVGVILAIGGLGVIMYAVKKGR